MLNLYVLTEYLLSALKSIKSCYLHQLACHADFSETTAFIHFFVNILSLCRVASRMRFPRDRALIRLQTRIYLESAVTKLYENA